MITPRATRLIRVPDLATCRRVVLGLCADGSVAAIRRRAVIVPSQAAAEQVRRSLEACAFGSGQLAVVVPHLLTRDEWMDRLEEGRAGSRGVVSRLEREVLLGVAARSAIDAGAVPPFTIRPGLVSEMLAFYDGLRRHMRSIDAFERVVVEELSRAVDSDRGAVRMLDQTRFLVAAFRDYEARLDAADLADEHGVRSALLADRSTPFTHVVLTVADRAGDPTGLWPADFDLLTRLPGLNRLDVVATEAVLASGFEQRVRVWLPEIADVKETADGAAPPRLVAPPASETELFWRYRDREEELAATIRRIKRAGRLAPHVALSRTAVVFKRPLPYVYLAGQAFPSAGVPFQAFDALPLAAEPFAAALDLLFECVTSDFSRTPLVTLLRSPWFTFEAGGRKIDPEAVALLDRGLSEARYLGGVAELDRLAAEWADASTKARSDRLADARATARAAEAAVVVGRALLPLTEAAPPTHHLDVVLRFLAAHRKTPAGRETWSERYLRAHAAILGALESLRAAHARFDDGPRPSADTIAAIHRRIEQQTFAPRRGTGGIQLVDAGAARFGAFDTLYVVGLTAREWPESPERSIFYPVSTLTSLGWPADADVRATARAAFEDLLHSASDQVVVSTMTLEDDAIVEPSPFLEDLGQSGLPVVREPAPPHTRVFADDAVLADPVAPAVLDETAAAWLELRLSRTPAAAVKFHGQADPARFSRYKVSSLDQYLGCPFAFFATHVLHLDEEPTDEESLGPKAQGRFVHEVLQAFFQRWQEDGFGAVTAANLEEARARFLALVDARLATLPSSDAALQRARLIGSPVAPGCGDIVFEAEAERDRGVAVVERLLEFSLDGATALRAGNSVRSLPLAAKADRIDLMADGTFRVIDYKLSRAPNLQHVVQLPAYAAAARARLEGHRGRAWRPIAAAYLAFGRGGRYVPLASKDAQLDAVLEEGEHRLVEAVDAIERGEFPPAPIEIYRCTYCPFSAVCRKDYVGDA